MSDDEKTPGISSIRIAQAARLTRLRTVLEIGLGEAAEMAGLSRHQWSRMERGLVV
jgi:predicted transcriptional regulator